MMKRLLIRALAVVLIVTCCFFLRQYLAEKDAEAERAAQADLADGKRYGGGHGYDDPVDMEHPALTWFGQTYQNREAFLGFAGDLTGDGIEDLVIVFHEDGRKDICWMCLAERRENGDWVATEPARAPVENQRVRVFDMDREPPLEYVITGEKNGQTGYAIYRMIDGELTDLFAEDMRDCC